MKTPMLFHQPDDIRSFAADAFAKAFKAESDAPEGEKKTLVPPAEKVITSEEKKVEAPAPVADDDDPPENLPNEGRSDTWKNFRGKYKETKGALKERDTELATLKAQLVDFDGTKKERDILKGQIADYEAQKAKWSEVQTLSAFDLRPDVQAQYVTPRNDALGTLKELSGYADVSPDAITGAMAKTGKARFEALEEILSAVPTVLRGKIERVIDQIDGLDTGLAKERGNAAESIRQRDARLAQERTQRQEAYNKQALEIFDATAAELKDLNLPADEIARAREFFIKNNDLKEATRILLKGHAADFTAKEKAAMKKELDEAKAELTRLKKSSPTVEGGGGHQQTGDKGLDFTEGAKAAFRNARAA
jgi:hypothetical protein